MLFFVFFYDQDDDDDDDDDDGNRKNIVLQYLFYTFEYLISSNPRVMFPPLRVLLKAP